MTIVNAIKKIFTAWHICLCFIINIFLIVRSFYFNKHTYQLQFTNQNLFLFFVSGVFIFILNHMIRLIYPMQQY